MDKQFLLYLLSSMSTEEKAAQLTQLNPVCFGHEFITPLTGPDFGFRVSKKSGASIGSVLNCDNATAMIAIQKRHMEEDPHAIPLLFMADIIHGFKTIFPIPLALGCSFSPELMEESCRIAAMESSVSGIHVTFSPMADLVRDPRWGRVMESCGEDPLLNARFSTAAVRGYQGQNLEPLRIASCVKHFAAYGAPEGGREYNTVDLSYGILRDTYLPAYRAALDAGAKLVMTSFNTVDRIPATANTALLRDILRTEWGFNGVVISDFNSVGELIPHGAAEDGTDAARKSLTAGVDIEMMSTHYMDTFCGTPDEADSLLDEAVLRVLTLKNELGLFENPLRDASPEQESHCHLSVENRAAARRIAGECAVLLKNNGVLPLAPIQAIGLTGPFAASSRVVGGWSAGSEHGISLYEGLTGSMSADLIHLAECGEPVSILNGNPDISFPDETFIARFKDCDTVIAAVGEDQADTGEGASKTNLRLSPNQELLLLKLHEAGKKVVAVVFSGRPLELAPALPYCDAVLQAWFLGTESGGALSDLLLGKINPSGRLTVSFPYTAGQIPVYYNHFQTGRPEKDPTKKERYVSRYLDCPNDPLFCFGYGLSYSEFEYSNFCLCESGTLTASVTVRNLSDREGTETVQLYIRDVAARCVRPVRELKDFRRVRLTGGESATIVFSIGPEMLSYYKTDSAVLEDGEYEIMIGRNALDTLSGKIYITHNTSVKEQV